MLIKTANFLIRLPLGGVFVLAGALKVFNPSGFADNIAHYRVFPNEYINLVAIILPWIEIAAGVYLVMGTWVRASALVTAVFSLTFAVFVTQALARGLNIECGCFGTLAGTRIGLQHLILDFLLLLSSVWLIWKSRD